MSWLKSRRSKTSATPARDGWARYGRVYILPTKFGAAFGGGAFLMILIGAAYDNNLVNLLGFFMLAMLFTAMITTHNNINGIKISRVETAQGFAGEHFPVSMVVHNTSRQAKSNCDFTVRGFNKIAQYDARITLPPQGDGRLLASFESPARGVHPLAKFTLSTTAPFGLFYAWQIQPSQAFVTIYPRRKGELIWSTDSGFEVGAANRVAGSEDYKEHRPYHPGDNLKRVDWKAYARGRALLMKEYDEPTGAGLHFDFQKLGLLDNESKLEQLTKWIDQAIVRGEPFMLSLPEKRIGPDRGLAFAHRAWTELAKFKSESKAGS